MELIDLLFVVIVSNDIHYRQNSVRVSCNGKMNFVRVSALSVVVFLFELCHNANTELWRLITCIDARHNKQSLTIFGNFENAMINKLQNLSGSRLLAKVCVGLWC